MLLLMLLASIAAAALSGIITKQEQDVILSLIYLSILCFVIFMLGLETYRLQKGWLHEKANNFKRIACFYGICCILTLIFQFLPEYGKPVMIFAVCMTMVTSSYLGILAAILPLTLLTLCAASTVYALLCNILLLICGGMIFPFLKKEKNQKWIALVIIMYSFGCITIFSYLETSQLSFLVLSYGLCNGIVSALGTLFIYKKLNRRIVYSRDYELKKILAEDFELVQEVQAFSKADYDHARRVSRIAESCAALLGADPSVAAAGGFYYRIGRLEGKPYVENGVALAKSKHFPHEVVEILQEYNGEQKLPSTIESAIVHIVDSVVAKFDVLDKTTLSSSWNQDILVYQTLNENSAAGLYDKSGFSMNMFLKIRDYLIKEAKLI